MLQAVLICLSGYDSPHIEIVKEKSKYTHLARKKIKFVKGACDILHINPSEQQMLEEILVLGVLIKDLQTFIKHYENKRALQGLYVMALCHGIRNLIDEYKHQIILFRRSYGITPTHEQSISICRLQKTFKKYVHLFECLHNQLCQEILDNHLFGGKILSKLLDLVILNGGITFIRHHLNQLLNKILYIWYNQITSFVAYGILSDPYSEFFIQQNETYCCNYSDKYQLLSWNNQFIINYSMFPIKHIPNHIVDKILFIGKSVRILNAFKYKKDEQHCHYNMDDNDVYDHCEIAASTSTASTAAAKNEINLMLTEEEMFSLSQQIHKLKLENINNVHRLEAVLNRIKKQIAHKLWAVLVFHLKLNEHLQTLRDYFLLGNGGFWQCLLSECTDIPVFETISVTVATRDLNFGPFKSAVTKCGLQNDELLDKVTLQFSLQKFSTRRKSIDLDHMITLGVCEKIAQKSDVLIQFKYDEVGPRRNGSCWMELKCPVQFGFNCRFNFVATPAADLEFAFVIQHDRINWWLPHRQKSDRTYGADICLNALVFGFSKQSLSLFSYDTCENKVMIQQGDSDMFCNCFDNKVHSVCIIFCESRSEMKVTLDDELVLFLNQFKVSKYVNTEIATGRAWVGITSCCSSIANPNAANIDVTQWSFSGKFMFESHENGGSMNGNESWKHAMKFWSRLNLEYRITNPMDIIFDSYDLERYNGLFHFLLLLRRAHFNVNNCWKQINVAMKLNVLELHAPISLCILSFSRRMLFFVSNLQFYIQFEVIDIEYKGLLNKINGTKNIELVMEAHQTFLHTLCRQCFLIGNDALWHYISKILCLVLQSTQLIANYIEKQRYTNHYVKQFDSEIKCLQKSFDSSVAQWFESAKNISFNQQSLYKLQRLISQLNYNNWFL
eukprot:990308_1